MAAPVRFDQLENVQGGKEGFTSDRDPVSRSRVGFVDLAVQAVDQAVLIIDDAVFVVLAVDRGTGIGVKLDGDLDGTGPAAGMER